MDVLGYTVFNDVSARDFQFADGQWQRGKSCDTFAPMGPAIVTTDDVSDPHKLMEVEIEKLGKLTSPVIAARESISEFAHS